MSTTPGAERQHRLDKEEAPPPIIKTEPSESLMVQTTNSQHNTQSSISTSSKLQHAAAQSDPSTATTVQNSSGRLDSAPSAVSYGTLNAQYQSRAPTQLSRTLGGSSGDLHRSPPGRPVPPIPLQTHRGTGRLDLLLYHDKDTTREPVLRSTSYNSFPQAGPHGSRKRQQPHNDSSSEESDVDDRPGFGRTLFFSSRDEALKGVDVPIWNAPRNDSTLPTTQAQRQHWVRKLVCAFLDISKCQDKKGPVFKKRWFDPDKPEDGYKNYYDRKAVEKVCWDIVDMVENLHRNGPRTFSCYDPAFQRMVAKTQSLTFEARLSKLIDLFSRYKARCDKMFKSSLLENYIADPEAMIQTAETNRSANDKRQKYIEEGRVGLRNRETSAIPNSTPTPINTNQLLHGSNIHDSGVPTDDYGFSEDEEDVVTNNTSLVRDAIGLDNHGRR